MIEEKSNRGTIDEARLYGSDGFCRVLRGGEPKLAARVAGWLRMRSGFCPGCNSDAPEMDDCCVCKGHGVWPLYEDGELGSLLWARFMGYRWAYMIDTPAEIGREMRRLKYGVDDRSANAPKTGETDGKSTK